MSIQRYRTDSPRTADEIADAIEAELNAINPNAPVVRGTENYAFVVSMARTLASLQEESLNELYDAAYITDATEEELTKRARGIGVIRQDAIPSTGVAKFSRDSPATQDIVIQSGTSISTGGSNPTEFETTEVTSIAGPSTDTDTTTYSTTNTSFESQTSFTVDVTYRESLDVSAEIRNTDATYTTELDVANVTDSVNIASYSTQNTSFTAQGPTSYDVSGLSGEITIEFQLRTTNSSGTAELTDSQVSPGGEIAAKANIACLSTGPDGNVGADTITVFIEQPAGVENVTNPNPTGDTSYTLTDGTTPQRTGEGRETDAELRERALDSTAIGGAGTAQALELALENIDEVVSADVYTNRADSTNNGIDPWHTEIRVYGGNANDIALRLYEVLPLSTLKTLQGGVNGTLEQVTLTESDLYGDLTIPLTRPTEISLDIEVDIVHDASYAGASDVKNEIVKYIGGTTTDARSVNGLGQGEDVLVNEIENVSEDVTGVDYADVTLVDDNNDGTDDTTTDSDGVPVYSVTETEVPIVDAANITLSETAR
jgi:hypothetical protein